MCPQTMYWWGVLLKYVRIYLYIVQDECAEAGIDGFIIVDLPPEEALNFRNECASKGLSSIPLIAPTTTREVRINFHNGRTFVLFPPSSVAPMRKLSFDLWRLEFGGWGLRGLRG